MIALIWVNQVLILVLLYYCNCEWKRKKAGSVRMGNISRSERRLPRRYLDESIGFDFKVLYRFSLLDTVIPLRYILFFIC